MLYKLFDFSSHALAKTQCYDAHSMLCTISVCGNQVQCQNDYNTILKNNKTYLILFYFIF